MGFSAMYVGSTGMESHAKRMQVISNNLANVSTSGFKASRVHFGTLMSTTVNEANGTINANSQSAGNISQIGKGVQVSAILGDFRQGSLEQGAAATDLAISGQGYFRVDDPNSGEALYTRTGNFRFDNAGTLRNPQGNIVQGFAFDRVTREIGNEAQNITLPSETITLDTGEEVSAIVSEPKETTSIRSIVNIDSSSQDGSVDTETPFFSLLKNYDGTSETPIQNSQYEYLTSTNVFDSEGVSHSINTYYDPVQISNASGGRQYFEYLVTSAPTSDKSAMANTEAAGLLMTGILEFNAAGEIVNNTAFTMNEKNPNLKDDLSNWTLAEIDSEGRPSFETSFLEGDATIVPQKIGIDVGVKSGSLSWNDGITNAAQIEGNPTSIPRLSDPLVSANASTAFNNPSNTTLQSQNGHSQGFLTDISVGRDGSISGHFDNGEREKLFQVGLYDFTNEWGLKREGGNMFSYDPEAGEISEGVPASGRFGDISQNSLESSNVDMAYEFTDLIITQRGFQANSKVITTTDAILQNLTQIKR